MKKDLKLIGPFTQLLTMDDIPWKGAVHDAQLNMIDHAGLLIEGDWIKDVGDFDQLCSIWGDRATVIRIAGDCVALPGFVDCHTHICYAGDRANDFALRNAGSSYIAIAEAGGGIWSTVSQTRICEEELLVQLTMQRAAFLLQQGITTIEVKSGYGLTVQEELKLLRSIKKANERAEADLIPTCLAAHMVPKDYTGTANDYLDLMVRELLPVLKEQQLANRVDAFIERTAFDAEIIRSYLQHAKDLGFDLTIHADQFSTSGSQVAVEFGALSADHLESSTPTEIELLASSSTVAVALPAASIGLGCSFAPARSLLDAGACLAIASDWNPGSAPMGQLLSSASILATMEKLSNAEVLSALTFRAAYALNLHDRGKLVSGMRADFILFETNNYQQITYCQGRMQPAAVWKNGRKVWSS